MDQPSWKPLFRTPRSTVTKVLRSQSFGASRERAAMIMDDPTALRTLAERVETLEHHNAPLAGIADRVAAAVRLLRAVADDVESGTSQPAAADAARIRLIVAGLHYLITPVDVVPDFRPGGYIDDVLLLTWIFGVAVQELEPQLDDPAE
ncbi:MAG: DUF1232 domain-containing protein [Nocardioidaceae bacterium]|nr:DUF1232 domain-containing protein [Nocardioidaceae bacterium]